MSKIPRCLGNCLQKTLLLKDKFCRVHCPEWSLDSRFKSTVLVWCDRLAPKNIGPYYMSLHTTISELFMIQRIEMAHKICGITESDIVDSQSCFSPKETRYRAASVCCATTCRVMIPFHGARRGECVCTSRTSDARLIVKRQRPTTVDGNPMGTSMQHWILLSVRRNETDISLACPITWDCWESATVSVNSGLDSASIFGLCRGRRGIAGSTTSSKWIEMKGDLELESKPKTFGCFVASFTLSRSWIWFTVYTYSQYTSIQEMLKLANEPFFLPSFLTP